MDAIDKIKQNLIYTEVAHNETLETIDIPYYLVDANVRDFATVVKQMTELYAEKNHDYGNSFDKGMDVIGLPYGVGRLYDKMNRIISLMKSKAEVKDETMEDTVLDLACYSVMLYKFITNNKISK